MKNVESKQAVSAFIDDNHLRGKTNPKLRRHRGDAGGYILPKKHSVSVRSCNKALISRFSQRFYKSTNR